MKTNIITALAAAALFMCSAVVVNAQDNTNQNQQTPAQHHMRAMNDNANATGCLQQGSNGGNYTLTGQDGSTWQLTSNAMDLGKYVGKEVSVAGTEFRIQRRPPQECLDIATGERARPHGRAGFGRGE